MTFKRNNGFNSLYSSYLKGNYGGLSACAYRCFNAASCHMFAYALHNHHPCELSTLALMSNDSAARAARVDLFERLESNRLLSDEFSEKLAYGKLYHILTI